MSIITIVGDTHIGKGVSIGRPGIGNALNSRIIDQIKLINWAYEKTIENNAEAIIFTGDIFHDPKPDFRTVDLFVKFLKNCEVHNISVHIAVGNHDIKRTGSHYISVLDIISSVDFPHVHVYKKPATVMIGDVGITFMPYRDRLSLKCETKEDAIKKLSDMLPYEVSSIPLEYDKILVGHLAIEGSIYTGDEYNSKANELTCPKSMFADYDYVWMGHVHPSQIMSKNNPRIEHIGSLDISDFGEEDQKKHIVVFNSSGKEKFKNIEVPSRPLRDIFIDVPDKEDPTKFSIKEITKHNKNKALKKAIVRLEVRLPGAHTDNVKRKDVETHIYSLGAYHICSFSESRNVVVVPINKQVDIDNTVDPKETVKLFAEQFGFKSDTEKERYIDFSNNIIDKHFSSNK